MASSGISSKLQQANYVLDACGRQQPPANTNVIRYPSHILYTNFMPGDGSAAGTNAIGAVSHKGAVPFKLRAITAQCLPREAQGLYWRLRLPSGRYFQSKMSSHAMAFGFGSDRQVLDPAVIWNPGEKMFVDLDTIIAGPPPAPGYTVSMLFEGAFEFTVSGNGRVRNPLPTAYPRYFLGASQNILAPEWAFDDSCPSETPVGYSDETFWYSTPTVDLPVTGQPVSNVAMQIRTDADFICREIWPHYPTGATNQGTGSVVVRIRRGDGYVLMSNFCPVNSIQGPMFPEIKFKAGDSLYFDAYVVDGSAVSGSVITFGLDLGGVNRKKAVA